MRTRLPRRHEIAEATLALVDHPAGEDDEADGVGVEAPSKTTAARDPS